MIAIARRCWLKGTVNTMIIPHQTSFQDTSTRRKREPDNGPDSCPTMEVYGLATMDDSRYKTLPESVS